MGICSPCAICEDAFQCLDTLRIGQVDEAETYTIILHDLTTDRWNHVEQDIADPDNQYLNLAPKFFAMNHTYRVSIEVSGDSKDIIVKDVNSGSGTQTVACVEFTMRKSRGDIPATQTLQLRIND